MMRYFFAAEKKNAHILENLVGREEAGARDIRSTSIACTTGMCASQISG